MNSLKTALACGVAGISLACASPAFAQPRDFDVPAMPASKAIQTFARQAGVDVLASGETLRGVTTNPVKGKVEVQDALNEMLRGTQLKATKSRENVYLIKAAAQPMKISYTPYTEQQPAPAAAAPPPAAEPAPQRDFGLEEIIVTAQKRAESLQKTPLSATALGNEQLQARGVIVMCKRISPTRPIHRTSKL